MADTVHENGLPAVIPELQVTVTTKGCGATLTMADPVAVAPFASVTLNDSVNWPFTGCVTENVPVPEYGCVPPVAETSQLNGFPAVSLPGMWHVTVTTNG